jgi:hypothetical protein
MGADYYVFQYLQVNHIHGVSYIELSCVRGYYCDCLDTGYDSDTNNPREYEEKIEKLIQLYLTPSIRPILIYNNSSFINERFYEKYNQLLEDTINKKIKYWKDTGHLLEDKKDILNIYKIEIRIPMS